MKKLISLLLAAAMCSSIALSGCGSSNDIQTAQSETEQSTEEETTEDVSKDSETSAKKVFVYPADTDVSNMLPNAGASDSITAIWQPLYDPLYTISGDEVRYYLVDQYQVSDDGLTIQLHFNESAKWHDGEPVTVDDLLFTVKYMAEGATRTKTTFTKIGDQEITYEKTDDYNVTITLPEYQSSFLTVLGRLHLYPAHVFDNDVYSVETSDAAMLGIGNGPFKLKEWNKGENIIYEKNPDYYRSEAKIDELIMKIIPDNSAKEVAFQSGEVSCLRITSKEKYEKYSADENYTVTQTPECRVNYFTCNARSTKITSKEAREAIFYAINLDEIMDTVYGSEQMSEAGKTVFCDQNLYFAKEMENYPYDLEKAKELAKKTGLDQVTLTYIYNNQRVGMPEVAVVIQQQLKAAGINVELVGSDSGAFFKSYFSWMLGDTDTSWDLATNGWDSMQGDPSTQITSYVGNPEATDCQEATVEALNEAIHATDESVREEKFLEFQQLIQDDFVIYPISCPNYVWVAQKGVTGLDTINSMIPFEDWTLIDVA